MTVSLATVCWATVALGGPADLVVTAGVNPAYTVIGGTTTYLDGWVQNPAGAGCTDIVLTAVPKNSVNAPLAAAVSFPLPIHVLNAGNNEYFHQAVRQPIGTHHWDVTVVGTATSYTWVGILLPWTSSVGPFGRRLYSFTFPTNTGTVAGLIGVGHEEENSTAPGAGGVFLDSVADTSQSARVFGTWQFVPLQLEGGRAVSMTYQDVMASATWVNYTPQPVYRFYNRLNGSHFYTTNETEKELVRTTMTSTHTFEGVGYYLGY